MKKYSFLVYHREYEQFLKNLQELGVLHVIEIDQGEIENEDLRNKYTLVSNLTKAIKFLEKREVEKIVTSEKNDGLKILDELQILLNEHEQYTQKLILIQKDLNTIEPWGEFSWENIKALSVAGLKARFFMSPHRKYEEEIKDNYFVEEINNISGHIYFVLFFENDEKIEIDAEEISLPGHSLSELRKQVEEINAIQKKTGTLFDSFASKYIPVLEKTKNEITAQLSFDQVKLNTQLKAENKLMILEGWAPTDKKEALNTFLESSGIYYESGTPEIEETPPIKLKNNRFAKLYEAIGELYTFPNYGEIDLTPFFAPFYMLFFGFCLGDAGYGLLITIGTIYGLFKAKPKVKPLLKLGMYLGIATTIMGMISGTFFGIMLIDVTWPWLKEFKTFMLDSDQMMALALGLGYIQVLFGMFIKAANKARMYGFKYSISQLGWNIIVMVTIPVYALTSQGVITDGIGNKIALISLIAGGIPAIFYNSPGKNPLFNLGVGLWETYQTASGLLGDVLSYIRLFALGISSAILGNVFNTLAMDLSPDTIIVRQIVMILILAFGHSLNFFMAALGSFVHPLRLTFVEFYKNAGFIGGGHKYEPFRN